MTSELGGAHAHADDPRNAGVAVYANGSLVPRDQAVVPGIGRGVAR